LRPQLKLVKAGPSFELNFKFLNEGSTFNTTPEELQAGAYSGTISPGTQNEIRALFPLLANPDRNPLVKPPFKGKARQFSTSRPPSSPETHIIDVTEVTTFSSSATATFSSEIKSSTTTTTTDPVTKEKLEQTFAMGRKFSISLRTAQELTTSRSMTLTLNLA